MLTKNFRSRTLCAPSRYKGYTFISNQNQKNTFGEEISAYHRRIKICTFFEGKEDYSERPTFIPPGNKDLPPEILEVIQQDLQTCNRLRPQLYRQCPNLNREEVQALNAQKKMRFIKPADKGSAVVLMDREQYIKEAERQLGYTQYYKKLD